MRGGADAQTAPSPFALAPPSFYKPRSYVGTLRINAEVQTDDSEMLELSTMHQMLRGLQSDLSELRTEVDTIKGRDEDGGNAVAVQRGIGFLYARVNEKLRWVEERHASKVATVRAACRTQLDNEIARISNSTRVACERLQSDLEVKHGAEMQRMQDELDRTRAKLAERTLHVQELEQKHTVTELLLSQQHDQVEALEGSLSETLTSLSATADLARERERLALELKQKSKLLDNLVRKLQKYQKREKQLEQQWQTKLNSAMHMLHRQHVAQLEDARLDHVRKEKQLVSMLQETQRRLYELQNKAGLRNLSGRAGGIDRSRPSRDATSGSPSMSRTAHTQQGSNGRLGDKPTRVMMPLTALNDGVESMKVGGSTTLPLVPSPTNMSRASSRANLSSGSGKQ